MEIKKLPLQLNASRLMFEDWLKVLNTNKILDHYRRTEPSASINLNAHLVWHSASFELEQRQTALYVNKLKATNKPHWANVRRQCFDWEEFFFFLLLWLRRQSLQLWSFFLRATQREGGIRRFKLISTADAHINTNKVFLNYIWRENYWHEQEDASFSLV